MDKIVAVWFNGFLAHYKVSGGNSGVFSAELIKFNGPKETSPLDKFPLHKEGRHWIDDTTNQDLLDELGNAIEIQIYGPDKISNPLRSSAHRRAR